MVEMAVVVALLGLVLAMAVQGLISYQRAAAAADTRQQNLEEARALMAVLTKDLRTATAFSAATASPITYTGTGTTRIVGRGLTATSGLLSYYDSSGTATTTLTAVASVVVTARSTCRRGRAPTSRRPC